MVLSDTVNTFKKNLINFGKTNLLHSILKLKFKEPEAEVGIRCYYSY